MSYLKSLLSQTVEKWPQPSFWMTTYRSMSTSLGKARLPYVHSVIPALLVVFDAFIFAAVVYIFYYLVELRVDLVRAAFEVCSR